MVTFVLLTAKLAVTVCGAFMVTVLLVTLPVQFTNL